MLNDNDSSNLMAQLSNDASTRHFIEKGTLEKENFMITFAMLSPRVSIDGNMYCVSYGEMPEGVHGFGDTINDAIADFNKQFSESLKTHRNKLQSVDKK